MPSLAADASAEASSLKVEQHSLEIARGIPPVNGVYICAQEVVCTRLGGGYTRLPVPQQHRLSQVLLLTPACIAQKSVTDLLVPSGCCLGAAAMQQAVASHERIRSSNTAVQTPLSSRFLMFCCSTLRNRSERARAASGEPQTARAAPARPAPQQRPGPRRLPTAADAEAMGVQWEKPTRDWR